MRGRSKSLRESGSPRHAGTCIDPSAMHGTSVRSPHTILAALVLSLRRICEKMSKKTPGGRRQERRRCVFGRRRARWEQEGGGNE